MNFNKIKPYLLAVVGFLIIAAIYFIPVFQGKSLRAHDTLTWKGMSKEVVDYREATGDEALWTNSMFGGMPAYLISVSYKTNLVKYIPTILHINHKNPHMIVFMYFIGFYILLLAFRVNPWLAMAGALAYGFSAYFIIILEAGHTTKAIALGYMPAVIAGAYLAFSRKKLFLGAGVFGLFLALQLLTNHFQITYYTFWILLFYGIYILIKEFTKTREEKQDFVKNIVKPFGFLAVALIFAVAANFTSIYLTYEYGKDSMRGKSELTITDQSNETSGLDIKYATAWSYGKAETFNLFIPNLVGGSSMGELDAESEVYDYLQKNNIQGARQIIKQLPLYWGPQSSTSGPVYIGAIVVFLFVFGMFFVKNGIKWWLFGVSLFAVLLSWGEHFMPLTKFFLHYVPMWNKFRVPSMILIMVQFTFPLLGILAVQELISTKVNKKHFEKSLYWAVGITGGIALIFAVMSGAFFDFESAYDAKLLKSGWNADLLDALRDDRQSMLTADAFRSLILVLIAASGLWLYFAKKMSKELFIAVLGALILLDLWTVDKRYVNNNDFEREPRNEQVWPMTTADAAILEDKDPNYRVLNLATNGGPFNDASTSYYHKSIGGYHGAKMKRYQELIEFHIYPEIQNISAAFNNKPSQQSLDSTLKAQNVLNMLNMKYLIYSPDAPPLRNPKPNGNAWFVNKYQIVANADEEITKLGEISTRTTALIDKRFENQIKDLTITPDSSAVIYLTDYKPNYLKYKSSSKSEQLAVFSEIYYDKGWEAYINGKPTEHFRADYVLRAIKVPAGENEIEFRFSPKMYSVGNIISLISSVLIFALLGFAAYKNLKKE